MRLGGAILAALVFAACSNIDSAGSDGGTGSTGTQPDGGPSTAHALNIHVSGSGSVASTNPAVSCAGDCTLSFDSSVVLHLTATPASGFQFDGWQGACSGSGACAVSMTADQSLTASFSQLAPVQPGNARLSVQFTGSGGGSVTSSPGGIDCPSACSLVVPVGTRVDLTPHPDANSTFVGFGGACSGTSCSVVVNAEATAFVNFAANAPPPPPPPPPAQPPAQCNGITPGPLPAAVSITTFTQATCSVGIGDRTGTLGLQSFATPGDDLHVVDAVTGTQITVVSHPNQDGSFVPTLDGFIGLLHFRSNPQPFWFPEYRNHRGDFVSSGTTTFGPRVFAGTPVGTVAVAGNISFSGQPSRPQLLVLGPNGTFFSCLHDLASSGTVFGLGGDADGRVLVITDGGAGRIEAQWFDRNCTPDTGAFTLIASFSAGEHTFFDTAPLIGGGVAVRRVDEQDDSAGLLFRTSSWLVTVGGGNASVQPAPAWLTSRPNTTMALAHGGAAYAMLPLGEPGVTCSQQVDVLASDGTLCGSLPLPIADGQCRTQDLGLSLDGTPIQLLPSNLAQPHTCAYRWWPFALR